MTIQNRLASAKSAYLRSAAHQPIDWYEFGEEAFQKARELERLILLDIGAVWCHWCHVIDRESYENPEIAELINAHFIPVKVDRDQRPDIDARYQQIVAAMSGQGGWPLTAFLTPDGRVLYGGTYFPPQAMKNMLNQLKSIYQDRRDEIMADSLEDTTPERIRQELDSAEAEHAEAEIPADTFSMLLESTRRVYDPQHGGFGHKPKFPHFSTLELLIHQAVRLKEPGLDEMIRHTLTRMASGGIYDQIGGGFHRYSVDERWHVPHFEKMAYDNAEALRIYAMAYRLYGDPLFRNTAEGIDSFVRQVLSNPETGGFYASQDADVDLDDDGDYFTWTLSEVEAVLPGEDAALIAARFGMTPEGDMHERPGRNVLEVVQSIPELAKRFNQPESKIADRLKAAQAAMLQHRFTRPAPYVDTTCYLNWNGMMLSSYFEAGELLEREDMIQFARKTLERMTETHVDSEHNQLLHSEGVPGFLEDYAWYIRALLAAYGVTRENLYLQTARHWSDVVLAQFEDKTYGGFFDTPAPESDALALLKFRRKPGEDTPSSSPNAVMIRNLLHLAELTGETKYHAHAEKALKIFAMAFARQGLFFSALALALLDYQHPPLRLAVLCQDESLIRAAKSVFYPGKLISYQPYGSHAQIQVCEGTRCLAPFDDAEAFLDYFRQHWQYNRPASAIR